VRVPGLLTINLGMKRRAGRQQGGADQK